MQLPAYARLRFTRLQGEQPNQQGRDQLEVSKAISADGKTITLQMPDLQKCMTLRIRYNIKGAKGESVRSEINCTINVLK